MSVFNYTWNAYYNNCISSIAIAYYNKLFNPDCHESRVLFSNFLYCGRFMSWDAYSYWLLHAAWYQHYIRNYLDWLHRKFRWNIKGGYGKLNVRYLCYFESQLSTSLIILNQWNHNDKTVIFLPKGTLWPFTICY